jgi:hypothetical protein
MIHNSPNKETVPKELVVYMKKLNKVMAVIAILFAASSFAADNTIYVDQAGDNGVITMTQDGASNRIRGIQGSGTGNTTPSKIKGDNVTLTVEQIGSGNILNLGVVTATASGGVDTSVIYKVTGNNAVGTINMNNAETGTANSNTVNIEQTGDGAIANLNMLGSNSSFVVDTAGGANNSVVATLNADQISVILNQTGGGGNSTTLNLTGAKGTVNLTSNGATNVTSITQSGGGVNGHNATLNITGSSNSTTITQSGTIDTTVNLAIAGSGNTYTIITGN